MHSFKIKNYFSGLNECFPFLRRTRHCDSSYLLLVFSFLCLLNDLLHNVGAVYPPYYLIGHNLFDDHIFNIFVLVDNFALVIQCFVNDCRISNLSFQFFHHQLVQNLVSLFGVLGAHFFEQELL